MDNDEFWEHVTRHLTIGQEYDPLDLECETDEPGIDPALSTEPCPVCGSTGACGYDVEGRPLIHVDAETDDEHHGGDERV